MPECPHCGERRLRTRVDVRRRRARHERRCTTTKTPAGSMPCATASTEPGHFLAFRDDERVSRAAAAAASGPASVAASTADIRLDDPTVSRRHALIVPPGRARARARRPHLNGLFLNGERVEWHDLQDGDELVVGRYQPPLPRHARVGDRSRPPRPTSARPCGNRDGVERPVGPASATRSKPTGRSARARGTDIRKCARRVGGDAADALRLLVLLGALELVRIVAEQLLHVGHALGVELQQGDQRALARAAARAPRGRGPTRR